MSISIDTATLDCPSEPVAVAFHPSANSFFVGCIDGAVQLYQWKQAINTDNEFIELIEGWEELADAPGDDENARAVAFLSGGDTVACGTSTGNITLYDSRSGDSIEDVEAEGEVYSLLALGQHGKVLASGQEDGVVSLWDVRKKGIANRAEFEEQSDYISDMCYNPRAECLVSTCGDGTLAVYDFRKGKFMERSDDTADDDMLCCTMAKGNSKIVVGSQEGVVNLFSWGHFEDCSDRFPNGHPDSIDCMVSYSDTQVITGCGDGVLRLVSILPNRVRAEIGQLEAQANVHCIALSHDKSILAAGADGEQLRLWSTEELEETCRYQLGDEDEGSGGDESSDEEERPAKKQKKSKKGTKKGTNGAGNKGKGGSASGTFFSGLL